MPKWKRHYLSIPLALVLCSAPAARSDVRKVNDFDLGSRDRKVLFDLATTPGGDALSLVAKDTGDWELYRVSDWLSSKPTVERLILHGYFSKKDSRRNEKPLEQLSARIFVTSDGKYAVCVASAEWLKRVRGWAVGSATSDDIISTVDLSTFKVVATTQTEDMNLFEFHSVDVDAEGRIRVGSLAFNGKVEHGRFVSSGEPQHAAFIRLRIPSLEAGPRCAYDWIEDSPGKRHPETTPDNKCNEALTSTTLGDYLRDVEPHFKPRAKVCENNSSEFCKVPEEEFTVDGKFGVGLRSEGHDNIFGSWVFTSETLIVFSGSRAVDIGEIEEPTNDSFKEKVVSREGRDFLLTIQSGTHLTVYELRD
jgi:hypothetical protein